MYLHESSPLRGIGDHRAAAQVNETKGYVPGSTASSKWPQQRRVPLGPDESLGVAKYVTDADEPHCVATRIQLD
ncbi:hypothetical protein [Streptomyces sp. NPDC059256]|uniref:hypothetical protein n=1 Tax=Streptomyces sp. NPDC059256 TaxID=3346794 RepID=UPI0036B235D9